MTRTRAAHAINVRQLPEIRAELVDWLTNPGEGGGPAAWTRGFTPAEAADERREAALWATGLRAGELFYVAADMARLAASAGLALPAYRLHPEDLPAPQGLLVWEEPVTAGAPGGERVNAPIVAACWAVRGNGVAVRTWAHREDWLVFMAQGDPLAGLEALPPSWIKETRAMWPQPIVSMAQAFLPFGRIPGWIAQEPPDVNGMSLYELQDHARSTEHQEQAERALVVTWLLMGQTLATSEDVQPSRTSEKFIRRIDPNLLRNTRYVQLRHRGFVPEARGNSEGPGRSYQHRWIVRGHWRDQYYPSRRTNRPIWIDPHVKGPDGAPILDPDKLVNVLRR